MSDEERRDCADIAPAATDTSTDFSARDSSRATQLHLCAIVPVYDHDQVVGAVVAQLRAAEMTVFLVDDGSHAACRDATEALARGDAGITLLRHDVNQGKGAAVLTGMRAALAAGFSHALQVDADGQHDLCALPALRALSAAHPEALVSGIPTYDASVPAIRFYGRYATHVLVWINTLSLAIRDSMCGFRIYPIRPCVELSERMRVGRRMDFDTDVMVRLFWAGMPVRFTPVRVSYPHDGVSHFDVVGDNLRLSRMHTRHFLLMLTRVITLRVRERGGSHRNSRGSAGATALRSPCQRSDGQRSDGQRSSGQRSDGQRSGG